MKLRHAVSTTMALLCPVLTATSQGRALQQVNQPRWEYAHFSQSSLLTSELRFVEEQFSWVAGGQPAHHEASLGRLAARLGFDSAQLTQRFDSSKVRGDIDLWSALGRSGWELIMTEPIETAEYRQSDGRMVHWKGTRYVFKRLAR